MFSNYLLVVIIILALWLGAMIFYMVSSQQQAGLQDEIEALEKKLDKLEQAQGDDSE